MLQQTIMVATLFCVEESERLDLPRKRHPWEATLAKLLAEEYSPAPHRGNVGYDYETRDHLHVIELKGSLLGARDLDAALVHLATIIGDRRELRRATLVARLPKMGAARVVGEWKRVLGVLRPDVAGRLGLVGIAADRDVAIPDKDHEVQRLRALARDAHRLSPPRPDMGSSLAVWTPKAFAVWEVLLDGWLRCEGPLAIQELERRSGCSHATVDGTLKRLLRDGEISRTRNRRAEFAGFPRRSLGENLVLADGLRETVRFVDGSGRRPDPVGLLRRIRAKAPHGAAIGGVEAARHYVPSFDLNGLPRIDVTVEAGNALEWVAALDPALRQVGREEPSPLLVVHRLQRSDPRFERAPKSAVPFADPAETLLDLYDLRLTGQAEDFVREMRRKEPRHE